jgi:hypothetical protein
MFRALTLMSSPALAQDETITRQTADAFGGQMGER